MPQRAHYKSRGEFLEYAQKTFSEVTDVLSTIYKVQLLKEYKVIFGAHAHYVLLQPVVGNLLVSV